jgi:hypothetical protein
MLSNYAWRETHGGRDLWVVRKGATPAFQAGAASSAARWATTPSSSRASRDRCRQTHVPGCVQPPSLHHLGQRLLRVAQKAGRQAWGFEYKTVAFYWVKLNSRRSTKLISSQVSVTGHAQTLSNAC